MRDKLLNDTLHFCILCTVAEKVKIKMHLSARTASKTDSVFFYKYDKTAEVPMKHTFHVFDWSTALNWPVIISSAPESGT